MILIYIYYLYFVCRTFKHKLNIKIKYSRTIVNVIWSGLLFWMDHFEGLCRVVLLF